MAGRSIVVMLSQRQQSLNQGRGIITGHLLFMILIMPFLPGGIFFLRALVTGKIDKARIRLSEDGAFTLSKGRNQFSGENTLKYSYSDQSEKALILNALELSEWYRTNNKDPGECEIRLTGLAGTIY